MEEKIQEIHTVRALYEQLTKIIQEDPRLMDGALVAISTGKEGLVSEALYSFGLEVVSPGEAITIVPLYVSSR